MRAIRISSRMRCPPYRCWSGRSARSTKACSTASQLITYPAGSEQSRRAESELRTGFADASETLRQAEEIESDLAGAVAQYRERIRATFETIEEAVQLGRAGQQAAAMQRLTDADTLMTELAGKWSGRTTSGWRRPRRSRRR